MLVLTRKIGESIRVGDDIEIVITEIDRKKVKIGIRSPRHIPVHRSELYQKIQEENREAAHMEAEEIEDINDMVPLLSQHKPLMSPENHDL